MRGGTMPKQAGLWDRLSALVGYHGPPAGERFLLTETEWEKETADQPGSPVAPPGVTRRRGKIRPLPAAKLRAKRAKSLGSEPGTPAVSGEDRMVSSRLAENIEAIRRIFHLPQNKDLVIREFAIAAEPPIAAAAVFIEGISDKQIINTHILQPLMLLAKIGGEGPDRINLVQKILDSYLPSNQVKQLENYADIEREIVSGSTVLFLDRADRAIAAETKGYEHRSVSDPKTEQVTLGPQIAFNEVLKVNTGLVRSYLRSPDLVTEYPMLPNRANSDIAVMYLRNIANPVLVQEVLRRIQSIRTDYMFESGRLEQFIEDFPYNPIPQTMRTERPDRVAGSLLEGRVAIFTTGSPFALVVPITMASLLQTAEDYYLRWPLAAWLRSIRLVSVAFALLLPAFYISIANFHQEMIPTDLILAITAARDSVPFPTLVELMLMELSFELIREAGIRVPGVIGPTIGIVGTLILGQAAVEAGIVSPILIIITAVTGLASFAIPNLSAAMGFRITRFFYIFLAGAFGFFGIAAGLFVQLCLMCRMTSFGVPMMAPLGPALRRSPDILLRGFVWQQERPPDELQAGVRRRQPRISRGWIKPYIKPGGEGDQRND